MKKLLTLLIASAALCLAQGAGAQSHAEGPNTNATIGPPVTAFSYADTFTGSNLTVHCIARSHGPLTTMTVTSVTNASPGVFTTSANGFQGGELVTVANVSNVPNGTYQVVVISGTTFSLEDPNTGAAVNTTSASTGGTITTDAPLLNQPVWSIQYFTWSGSNAVRVSWAQGDATMRFQCSNAANYAHE